MWQTGSLSAAAAAGAAERSSLQLAAHEGSEGDEVVESGLQDLDEAMEAFLLGRL